MKYAEIEKEDTDEESPSLRRVWVEIKRNHSFTRPTSRHPPCGGCGLKCKTDRRTGYKNSHPPCGGCGLKCFEMLVKKEKKVSPSLRRVWVEISSIGNTAVM